MTYGLSITVTRSDVPGVELKVNLPVIEDVEYVSANNPVIAAILKNFDKALHSIGEPK